MAVMFVKSMLEAHIASPDIAVAQARATFADDNDHSNNAIMFRQVTTDPHPTAAEKASGNYDKRKVGWRGMTIAIENEAGSTRSGTNRDGQTWTQKMPFAYGEIHQTEGVDGDCVDCFMGPDEDAQFVYVVHARKVNRWDEFDEDKVMLDFSTEEEAAAAFLASYSDSRFLGPITAMPVGEFIEKVRNTNGQPAMIKGALFMKAHVKGYTRKDGTYVPPHNTSQNAAVKKVIAVGAFKLEAPPSQKDEPQSNGPGMRWIVHDSKGQIYSAVNDPSLLDQHLAEARAADPQAYVVDRDAGTSAEYQRATAESGAAFRVFEKARMEYRAGKIDDKKFLAARAVRDAAQEKWETAYAKEQSGGKPKPASDFAEDLSNASSTDRFKGGWSSSVRELRKRGYNDKEVEAIIRSKHSGAAADISRNEGKPYGRATGKDLGKYIDKQPDFAATVDQLVRETFPE